MTNNPNGRPRRVPDEPSDRKVTVRFTVAEIDRLRGDAQRARLKLAEYVRSVVLATLVGP